MAVSLDVKIDAKTLGDLGYAIDRLQAETGRSTSDAVTFAALTIAQSGRSASKTGKKNRTILVNPTWEEAKRSSASARRKTNRSKKTGKPANLTHKEKVSLEQFFKEPPFFIVRRRQNSNAKTSIGTDFRVARYMETLGSEEKSVAVRLVNKLSYLEKAYPGITSEAITKGANRLHKTLDDKIAKAVKKANSGR